MELSLLMGRAVVTADSSPRPPVVPIEVLVCCRSWPVAFLGFWSGAGSALGSRGWVLGRPATRVSEACL